MIIINAEHLGSPIACNAVKLIDVPELNIFTKDTNVGEVGII